MQCATELGLKFSTNSVYLHIEKEKLHFPFSFESWEQPVWVEVDKKVSHLDPLLQQMPQCGFHPDHLPENKKM